MKSKKTFDPESWYLELTGHLSDALAVAFLPQKSGSAFLKELVDQPRLASGLQDGKGYGLVAE